MKRFTPLLLAFVFVACDDETEQPSAVPTAPVVAPMAASASTAAAITGGSTICRVYATERDVAKTELDAAPTDTLRQQRVTTLDALVKETCN